MDPLIVDRFNGSDLMLKGHATTLTIGYGPVSGGSPSIATTRSLNGPMDVSCEVEY